MQLRLAASFLALGLLACQASQWLPAAPSGDPREEHVLAETERYAKHLGIRTHGKLTDDPYFVPCDWAGKVCIAAGWYSGDTIWYYRPEILRHDLAFGTEVARHEVCHGVAFHHGADHEACLRRLTAAFG